MLVPRSRVRVYRILRYPPLSRRKTRWPRGRSARWRREVVRQRNRDRDTRVFHFAISITCVRSPMVGVISALEFSGHLVLPGQLRVCSKPPFQSSREKKRRCKAFCSIGLEEKGKCEKEFEDGECEKIRVGRDIFVSIKALWIGLGGDAFITCCTHPFNHSSSYRGFFHTKNPYA